MMQRTSVGGFPRHVQWTCLGKIFHGFEVSSSVLFFPDMFIEHVWENFWYHGGPRRGVHFPDMFIKTTKKKLYPHFFQMGVVWVMVCLCVRISKKTLFHKVKLPFFGLGVRVYPKFLQYWFGFGLNFENLGVWIRFFSPTFCKKWKCLCRRPQQNHFSFFI